MHCIACGSDLYFLPDSYPLAFHCMNGHYLTIQDLLDQFLPLTRAPSIPTLEVWERSARVLHELAAQSLQQRHALNAADFQETAGRIDRWVAQLRRLLPKTASSPSPPDPAERRNRAPEVL